MSVPKKVFVSQTERAQIKNLRAETRIGCLAKLGLKLDGEKYKVHQFVEEHNHALHTEETSHMLRSQREITEAQEYEFELAKDAGLRQKACFNLVSIHAGEGGRDIVGSTRLDAKNYLMSRRQRNMAYGDASVLLNYFQKQVYESPSFFHAYQMESDEQITNVFWADLIMLIDYGLFRDVVTLDTTFGTNKKGRPFAVFCGFNHFRGIVIFRATLLYDENTESFKWLFETFLQAHQYKYPLTIFTDRDASMTRALKEVMPNLVYGLCTWHLMLNAPKHLAYFPSGKSHILRELSRCMYEIVDEDEFEAAWCKMLIDHNVQDNMWLASTYEIKQKWATCFMKMTLKIGHAMSLMEALQFSPHFPHTYC